MNPKTFAELIADLTGGGKAISRIMDTVRIRPPKGRDIIRLINEDAGTLTMPNKAFRYANPDEVRMVEQTGMLGGTPLDVAPGRIPTEFAQSQAIAAMGKGNPSVERALLEMPYDEATGLYMPNPNQQPFSILTGNVPARVIRPAREIQPVDDTVSDEMVRLEALLNVLGIRQR